MNGRVFSVSLPLAIKNKLISLDRTTKQLLVFTFDIFALQFTLTLSFYFRLESLTFISHNYFWIISLTNLLSTSVAIYMFGIHRNVLRYVSIIAFQKLFFAILFGCITSFSIAYLLGHYPPRSTPVLYFATRSDISIRAKDCNEKSFLLELKVIKYQSSSTVLE